MKDAIEAIETGNLEAPRRALAIRPDLATRVDDVGDSLLHLACRNRDIEAVKLLLEFGADVDARGHWSSTTLHLAVSDSSSSDARPLVELLLAHGADPSLENEGGFNARAWAERDLWDRDEALLSLLGKPTEAMRGAAEDLHDTDFETVSARVRAIELQACTEAVIWQLLQRFGSGDELASIDVRRADEALVYEFTGLLTRLELEPLAPFLRALLGSVKAETVQSAIRRRPEG